MGNKLRWLLPVVLTGSFIAVPSIFAQKQPAPVPVGNRMDRQQNRRALRHDVRRINRQQARLHADARRFGSDGPQVRADRRQLRRSQQQFRHQTRELRQDRRQASRR